MIDLFLPFLLYSFLGFLLELLHARVHGSRGHGRKCLLFLPLCPVYGFGTLAILHMPAPLLNNPLTVFLAGGLLATLVEYGVALFYQVGAGVKFWDYSQQPGNLGGKICPLYTLFWGLLSLPLVYVFHPFPSPASGSGCGFARVAAPAPLSLFRRRQPGFPVVAPSDRFHRLPDVVLPSPPAPAAGPMTM